MNTKILATLLASLLSLSILTGCAVNNTALAATTSLDTSARQQAVEATYDENDVSTEYSAQSNDINLSDYATGAVITLDAAGEYVLSGTLADGQIVVATGDEDKVQLVLNNAKITNGSGPAILVENADKVVITLVENTNNYVKDGANYTDVDEDGEPNAAIFSHDDLTINGSGSLTIEANYADGVQSRDDLKITGGNITITAADDGLFGNDSVETTGAKLTIIAGDDAIHSDGDIIVQSGALTLRCGDDGMHADGTLTVNDGTIDIQACYEGLEATDVVVNGGTIDIVADDDGINGAGGTDDNANSTTTSFSRDSFGGSEASITINGGTITIAAAGSGAGDGLDANGSITVTGGDTVIKTPTSYRDYSAVDCNTTFTLTGGSVRTLDANGTYTQVTQASSMGGGGRGRH